MPFGQLALLGETKFLILFNSKLLFAERSESLKESMVEYKNEINLITS